MKKKRLRRKKRRTFPRNPASEHSFKRVWLLPADVSVEEEGKRVGAKRIAPERVAHQQMSPTEGMRKVRAETEGVMRRALEDMMVYPYGIRASAKVFSHLENVREKIARGAATELESAWYEESKGEIGKARNFKKAAELLGDKDVFRKAGAREQIEAYLKNLSDEAIRQEYVDLVKKDISKGYRYPREVLEFDRSFSVAVDNRGRYEKGLRTSFSVDDERIVFDAVEMIGVGMKRQDGKELTDAQKREITEGVLEFAATLGIDMKKLAENERWVYVHLNGKNPFLTRNAAGLYRQAENNISISVGGVETFEVQKDGQLVKEKVNTTVAHELGHALDHRVKNTLFDYKFLNKRALDMNPVDDFSTRRETGYWRSRTEVTARAIEQYVAIRKGNDRYFTRQGYWNQKIFESEIAPAVVAAIKEHYAEYQKEGES